MFKEVKICDYKIENDLKRHNYPLLEINLNKVYENAKNLVNLCNKTAVNVTGVIKGCNGISEVARQFLNAGCDYIASSRIPHLIKVKKEMFESKTMLIRIPMPSEIHELVKYVDVSLVSELETIKLINYQCQIQDCRHGVILMFDLGDLREGFFHRDDLIKASQYVENELENVDLMGIGTNLGCYGSIKPTEANLALLCLIAEDIEKLIGRKLDIISGGATSTLPLVLDGRLPNKINNLRIGEGILSARDLDVFWGYDMDFMHQDAFILKTQVVEVKTKPSHPIGEIFVDAFGNKPSYEDKGLRRRAILAIGRQDFGSHDKLIPRMPGVQIIGSSSDHLLVDVEDSDIDIKLGDIIDFELYYPALLYSSSSNYVEKIFL